MSVSAAMTAPAPSRSSTAKRSGDRGSRDVSSPHAITAMLVRAPRCSCTARTAPATAAALRSAAEHHDGAGLAPQPRRRRRR